MSSTRIHRPIRTYTHNLCERRASTESIPYGCYKFDSAMGFLPGGLFHFIRDADCYLPTLHGLTPDFIRGLKEVGVCTSSSSLAHRPFLNLPQLYEVELINTGREPLMQGDRFTVQLPNREDVAAQLDVETDQGYDLYVNKGIWGGLLATRRVDCEGDPVEEVIQAIKHDQQFDMFQLISPYTPQSTFSMMSLVANGAEYHNVPDDIRTSAAAAVNGDFDAAVVGAIVESEEAKKFLRTSVGHALNIVECVQGFAGGQVIRACSGHTCSSIKTGDRFMAQLNLNRWLC